MSESATDVGIAQLHARLDAHFKSLRQSRDEHAPGIPIFALEHGLSHAELMLLRAEVAASVRSGRLPRDHSLPFVVYAAEIGYMYSGDEYWPTFEAETPSWTAFGDDGRQYIRRQFKRFSETFDGARPSGAWARQFSIIAVAATASRRRRARSATSSSCPHW